MAGGVVPTHPSAEKGSTVFRRGFAALASGAFRLNCIRLSASTFIALEKNEQT